MAKRRGTVLHASLALALSVLWAGTASADLLVDRGLPDANLNNPAGADRSNVAWAEDPNSRYFTGDDFTVSGSGTVKIDTIRTWVVSSQTNLGDKFDSVTLYTGIGASNGVSALESGNFSSGTNSTNNSNIVITQATYAANDGNGRNTYQGTSGSYLHIYQVDFTNLNWTVSGGDFIKFGVQGLSSDPSTYWFNHASNAALSGTPQAGSDNLFRIFDATNLASGDVTVDSNGNGWDKSSDINVQVFGTAVPEPSTMTVALLGALAFASAASRTRRRVVNDC